MSHQRTAIVLDAEYKSALAVIRSLGRQGVRVIAGAQKRTAPGLFSRYVSDRFIYPSPIKDRDGFVDAIKKVAHDAGGDMSIMYVFTDATTLTVSRVYETLKQSVVVLMPDPISVEQSFDKAETVKIAQELSVKTPHTWFVDRRDDLDNISEFKEVSSYPLVIKPRHNVVWDTGGRGVTVSVRVVMNFQELRKVWDDLHQQTHETPIVQEFVRGEERGFVALCQEGVVLVSCAHRRIRSLSPLGGASVVKQTVSETDLNLRALSETLIKKLVWTGPIMVEYKIDDRDGKAALIEINGRFWGALPLAVSAGVDIPYAYYQTAQGIHIPPISKYKIGTVSRHWWGDVRHLLTVLFKQSPLRHVAYPSRWKTVKDFFGATRMPGDMFSVYDIKPALIEPFYLLLRQFS